MQPLFAANQHVEWQPGQQHEVQERAPGLLWGLLPAKLAASSITSLALPRHAQGLNEWQCKQDLSALGQEASYEDVCRAHMEAFIAAAAAAETQTALGARVSDWRHKIGPILDEQVKSCCPARVKRHTRISIVCWQHPANRQQMPYRPDWLPVLNAFPV